MDLNENIKIAAEMYEGSTNVSSKIAFIDGAKSQQAKEYWFAEFKREEASRSVGAFVEHFGPSPIESVHCQGFFDGIHKDLEKEFGEQAGVGIVGHGPRVVFCGSGRINGEFHLQEMMLKAKERGISIVGVGDGLPEALKGLSEVYEFTRRPEIVMPAPNFKDEDFKLTSYASEYFPPKEVKPYDRKHFPQRMNNPKVKKRNKR